MHLGSWQLDTVSGGQLWLDGGAMFGLVPKPLWEKVQPADPQNRIPCATHCVLARNGRQTVLIDSGYGGKESERARQIMSLDQGDPLIESLQARGVSPDDVDLVVLSHLHFDHAGGCTRRTASGEIVPTFPRARLICQRAEWEDAQSTAIELTNSYPPEHIRPLVESGLVDPIEGETELLPGLRVVPTPGHTRGHQAIVLSGAGETAVYWGDLCPTTAHTRVLWCMGYDLDLRENRRQKHRWLGQAADQGWWVLWAHDPRFAVSRLVRDPKREYVADLARSLL